MCISHTCRLHVHARVSINYLILILKYNFSSTHTLTAGPTFDTMGDFWRMVWEQEVGVVIMITGLIERGVVSPLHQSTPVHS